MATTIQLRRGTASSWTSANTLLAAGEIGYESDTGLIKFGTGALNWNSLSYAFAPYTGSSSIVTLGTVTAGSFPAANLSGTTLASGVTLSSLTKVGALSGGTAGFVKVDTAGNLTSDNNTYLTTTGSGTGLSGVALTGSANTFLGAQTAYSFIPTSSTVPVNGLYLSAANTVALSTNTTNRFTIDSTGLTSITGSLSVTGATTITGDLTINGTTTTLNVNTVTVDDKNIELGSVASGVISTTGTIGTVSGAGPFTATITGMSSTTGLIPGSTITATAGTGSFGSGVVTVASIVSSTSITISSTLTFTAGTVTNITSTGSTDTSASGGGISLLGTTNKSLIWQSSATTGGSNTGYWNLTDNLNLGGSALAYYINGTSVLTSSVVLGLTRTLNTTGWTLSGGVTNAVGVSFTAAGAATYTISGTTGTTYTLPSATATLYGTSAGSITATQLATSLSSTYYTGTIGKFVFDSSPTITTPTIDTINTSITTAGTAALFNSGITTGTISIGASLTTGTLNLGTGTGAATIGIGRTGATTTINGTLTLGTALATGSGGTGLTTFTSGGAVYATSTSVLTTGTLPISAGGLGITTTPVNGAIPIGTGSAYSSATITAGTGISVTNGSGSITIAATTPDPIASIFVFGIL